MPELIELDDGRLLLPTDADPAKAGHERIGFRRYSCGLDVGGRGSDPSAFVVVKAEARPFMTGRGWEQALTAPEYTVVYTEAVRLDEATDVVEYAVCKLRQMKNWTFTFDASGLGAPLVSMFEQAKVDALGITITPGASVTRRGNVARVSKNVLFENAASLLETGQLRIAADLPERNELFSEMTSVEYGETSAGTLVLKAGGRGHHADRFSALCLALIRETHLPTSRIEVSQLAGYWS